jgi:hypothetical protein
MRRRLSYKQRINIGRLSWWIMFLTGGSLIWKFVSNNYIAGSLVFVWGSFVYLINPYLLKELRVWK